MAASPCFVSPQSLFMPERQREFMSFYHANMAHAPPTSQLPPASPGASAMSSPTLLVILPIHFCHLFVVCLARESAGDLGNDCDDTSASKLNLYCDSAQVGQNSLSHTKG